MKYLVIMYYKERQMDTPRVEHVYTDTEQEANDIAMHSAHSGYYKYAIYVLSPVKEEIIDPTLV